MLQVTVSLTFDLVTQTSIGIIYGSWQNKTPTMVFLSLIGFKLLSGHRDGHANKAATICSPLRLYALPYEEHKNQFQQAHLL